MRGELCCGEEGPRDPPLDLIYNRREYVPEQGLGPPVKYAGMAFRPDVMANGG